MVPQPVTTESLIYFCLSRLKSCVRCWTKASISRNEPLSSKRSILSRAVRRPFLCCESIRSVPPPRRDLTFCSRRCCVFVCLLMFLAFHKENFCVSIKGNGYY